MGKAAKVAGNYTTAFARQVLLGLADTVKRKEPGRWAKWSRQAGIALGVYAVRTDDAHEENHDPGDGVMPPLGIDFDITPDLRKRCPPELLGSVRRLHVNTGHPTNEDLRRCLKVAGASEMAQMLAKNLRCSTCARLQRPKVQRPSRVPQIGVQFNETVYADLMDVMDAKGRRHWVMVIVDLFTDYNAVKVAKSHDAAKLF